MQQQNIFPLHQRPDIPLKVHSVWSLMFITSRERLHYSHHYTYSGFKINFFFNQQLHFVTQINTKNSPRSLEYKHKKENLYQCQDIQQQTYLGANSLL